MCEEPRRKFDINVLSLHQPTNHNCMLRFFCIKHRQLFINIYNGKMRRDLTDQEDLMVFDNVTLASMLIIKQRIFINNAVEKNYCPRPFFHSIFSHYYLSNILPHLLLPIPPEMLVFCFSFVPL